LHFFTYTSGQDCMGLSRNIEKKSSERNEVYENH
jgi:hypothetical protein